MGMLIFKGKYPSQAIDQTIGDDFSFDDAFASFLNTGTPVGKELKSGGLTLAVDFRDVQIFTCGSVKPEECFVVSVMFKGEETERVFHLRQVNFINVNYSKRPDVLFLDILNVQPGISPAFDYSYSNYRIVFDLRQVAFIRVVT